ncbi:MAG: AtpZ/AtpI family protein [Cryomorphaceae bacterium]|nr:AtpZ/AtpI family protein [Cryomorphaceae bacterium]
MSKENQPNRYIQLTGIVFQMAAVIGGFTFFGHWLDGQNLEREFPLYTLIFSLLGVAIALYLVIKEVVNISR